MARGGARPGSGRKPMLNTQVARATQVINELQKYVRGGLGKLGEHYALLISEEIKTALYDEEASLAERQKARHFLINLFSRSVPLQDSKGNPLDDLVSKWGAPQLNVQVNVSQENDGEVAGEGTGTVIETEYKTVG